MILSLLAAAFTFTATATGVEKGTSVEFFLAGNDSDRDYETVFLLEKPVADFVRDLERAGLRPGMPIDRNRCRLWPVGCPVQIEPSLDKFVTSSLPNGEQLGPIIYSGGSRGPDGGPEAATNMPKAVLSYYTLDQSLFLFNGLYEQGDVYGCHTAKTTLKKGEQYAFTITWDNAKTPQSLSFLVTPGKGAEILKELNKASEKGEVVAEVGFDGELTVAEAMAVSKALSVVDSVKVKINGCREGSLFYRAFLPLVKWLDRKERLVQPFELTIGNPDKLVFIDEDWTVEGDDPKLTTRQIPLTEAKRHPKTDTCLIFATKETKLSQIYASMRKMGGSSVRNWYVFADK